MIRTIKDLKEIIKTLPDDMKVMGNNGKNGNLIGISHWIVSEDTLTKEVIRACYPMGVIPTLVISTN